MTPHCLCRCFTEVATRRDQAWAVLRVPTKHSCLRPPPGRELLRSFTPTKQERRLSSSFARDPAWQVAAGVAADRGRIRRGQISRERRTGAAGARPRDSTGASDHQRSSVGCQALAHKASKGYRSSGRSSWNLQCALSPSPATRLRVPRAVVAASGLSQTHTHLPAASNAPTQRSDLASWHGCAVQPIGAPAQALAL